MIHHFSFAAREPERVARVIAELWGGRAEPFRPVAQGSWVARADDERGTLIEVYQAGVALRPADGDADSEPVMLEPPAYVATHAAIASPLSADAVHAMAAREGWISKYRKRGGIFGVIEFWVENAFMLEVLTPDMQREYLSAMSPQQVRADAPAAVVAAT